MIICPKCKTGHNREGLPPSLADKLNICKKCYKETKQKSDRKWRKANKLHVKNYEYNRWSIKSARMKADLLKLRHLKWKYKKVATNRKLGNAVKEEKLEEIQKDIDYIKQFLGKVKPKVMLSSYEGKVKAPKLSDILDTKN